MVRLMQMLPIPYALPSQCNAGLFHLCFSSDNTYFCEIECTYLKPLAPQLAVSPKIPSLEVTFTHPFSKKAEQQNQHYAQ